MVMPSHNEKSREALLRPPRRRTPLPKGAIPRSTPNFLRSWDCLISVGGVTAAVRVRLSSEACLPACPSDAAASSSSDSNAKPISADTASAFGRYIEPGCSVLFRGRRRNSHPGSGISCAVPVRTGPVGRTPGIPMRRCAAGRRTRPELSRLGDSSSRSHRMRWSPAGSTSPVQTPSARTFPRGQTPEQPRWIWNGGAGWTSGKSLAECSVQLPALGIWFHPFSSSLRGCICTARWKPGLSDPVFRPSRPASQQRPLAGRLAGKRIRRCRPCVLDVPEKHNTIRIQTATSKTVHSAPLL